MKHDERHIVKAEANFEDHPYFTVGQQRSGEGVIECYSVIKTKDGQELQQTWKVRAVHGLGLPGTLDQDVYVALLQIVERQGRLPTDGWVGFSLYELIELLRRGHGGRDYRQVKDSLERLSGTVIQSKNAFYRKSQRSYLDKTFHLLEEVRHSETRGVDGGGGERTWVKLSEYFVESYQANYLKGLDADFYWSLNSPVAKRLYRFVDKKRNNHRRWEAELFSLRDRIPLSRYKYPSKIREKLAPAHDELRKKGFFENITYRKTTGGEQLVCYEIQESFSRRRPQPDLDMSPEFQIAVERLKAEGIRSDTSAQLVADYGPERCLRYAEALPYQKGIRSPAGWLRRAIEEAYDLDAPPTPKAATPEKLSNSPGRSDADLEVPNGNGGGGGDTYDLFSGGEELRSAPPEPDPKAELLWRQVLDTVANEADTPSFYAWFESTVPTSIEDNILTVVAPNTFAQDYIARRFHGDLELALSSYLGRPARLIVTAGSS